MRKEMVRWMLAVAFFVPCLALAEDFQVSCEKKGERDAGKKKDGHVAKTSDDVIYTIGVANNTSADKGPLEVKYIIFVEKQEAGRKRDADVTKPVKGKSTLAAIPARKKSEFDTTAVTLNSERLAPGFYYPNGGRQKAQDNVKGVWIRVFDGDKMVADYSNPPTIAKQKEWVE